MPRQTTLTVGDLIRCARQKFPNTPRGKWGPNKDLVVTVIVPGTPAEPQLVVECEPGTMIHVGTRRR